MDEYGMEGKKEPLPLVEGNTFWWPDSVKRKCCLIRVNPCPSVVESLFYTIVTISQRTHPAAARPIDGERARAANTASNTKRRASANSRATPLRGDWALESSFTRR